MFDVHHHICVAADAAITDTQNQNGDVWPWCTTPSLEKTKRSILAQSPANR